MMEIILLYTTGIFGCLAFAAGHHAGKNNRDMYAGIATDTNEDLFYTVVLCAIWPFFLIAGFHYSDNLYMIDGRKKLSKIVDNILTKH